MQAAVKEKTCFHCVFSGERLLGGVGPCQFYPPHPKHGFPRTHFDQWCGQFKDRDEVARQIRSEERREAYHDQIAERFRKKTEQMEADS